MRTSESSTRGFIIKAWRENIQVKHLGFPYHENLNTGPCFDK